jgi:sterol desaturase/sphingolipid hydroxylase (fatty acid hydroxylase superfamily)
MGYYYWPKISSLWQNPEVFWQLVLDATHLSDVFTKATAVTLILFVVAAVVDVLALGWEKSGLRKLVKGGDQSVWNDVWCYLLSVVRIFDVLSLVASLGLSYFLASVFLKYFQFSLSDYIQHDWLKLVIVFVLMDFVHYVQHKFMHLRPFWELHAYHHSAEEFTLLTTARGHVLEGAIYFLFSGMFYALIGGDDLLEVIFYLSAIREGYQYLLHSDVNWHLGWVGKYILISPAAHRLHHSIREKDYNKNYGTFFVWWDKLFGTYGESVDYCTIGIDNNPYNKLGFLRGQWEGMIRFFGIKSEK